MKNITISKDFKNITKKKIFYTIKSKNNLKLSNIGIQDGFIDNICRIKAYEKLMNFNLNEEIQKYITFKKDLKKTSKSEKENYELDEDIKRSFTELKENSKTNSEIVLKNFLNNFFLKNSKYKYYQGFNSIAKIFLKNFGPERGFCLLEKFSEFLLEEFLISSKLAKNLEKKQKNIIKLINKHTQVNFQPMHLGLFLNWLISYFSQIQNEEIIFRIWDFLISLKNIYFTNSENLNEYGCFIDSVISSILIFFIKAKSIDQRNLKNNFFDIFKDFDINKLKDFDFKIILNHSFRFFSNYL